MSHRLLGLRNHNSLIPLVLHSRQPQVLTPVQTSMRKFRCLLRHLLQIT
jgi:hypothetical protein